MKRVLIFCSAILLILLLPFHGMAQEAVTTAVQGGFFHRIGDWMKNNAIEVGVTIIGTLLAKNGWSQIIKKFAHKGAEVTKEIGEFFADGSTFLATLDNAIKEDGTIVQNSVPELLSAGKAVIAEGKDVIISIKPKA